MLLLDQGVAIVNGKLLFSRENFKKADTDKCRTKIKLYAKIIGLFGPHHSLLKMCQNCKENVLSLTFI